jgi:hypothetical protein
LDHLEALLYNLRQKHFCIARGEADGCTMVLKDGIISMPTGNNVDNDFIPGLKTKTDF